MQSALESACDELYNNTAIDYYEIAITYDHPSLGNDSDSTTGCNGYGMLDRFNDYLNPKNPPVGSHLLVTDYIQNGCANKGNNGSTVLNGNWQPAVVGTEFPKEVWKNGGIHEVLHNCLDKSVIEDYDSTYIDESHHDLGKVYCGGLANNTSPMSTGYENDAADRGHCSDGCVFEQAYTTNLTSCTVESIDQIANQY
ncbi:hypothetical protein [Halorussus sp. MSC15.2]|uniref:hypothetical protein n=1 Tax=Halorussus sp. MSC15.2 TaxID=2283638 RepID=UPI0013D004F7|nr:hypothetical protein [Halorussus sp. MSC15.2]NEU56732.1 hypothetical protein [Halorussus sp. MSC15.2]